MVLAPWRGRRASLIRLVFARRRCVRGRSDADRRWRYLDPVLGNIAALAETAAPRLGGIVTDLFQDYFQPGAGDVLFQDSPDDPGEKAPPLELSPRTCR